VGHPKAKNLLPNDNRSLGNIAHLAISEEKESFVFSLCTCPTGLLNAR